MSPGRKPLAVPVNQLKHNAMKEALKILDLDGQSISVAEAIKIGKSLQGSSEKFIRDFAQKLAKPDATKFVTVSISKATKTKLKALTKEKAKGSRLNGIEVQATEAPQKQVMTLSEAKNVPWETISLAPEYEAVIGKPTKKAHSILIHGSGGSGKTTFMLQYANYLANNYGKVIYVTSEEFGTGTLSEKINRLGINSNGLHFAESLKAFNPDNYRFVFIDSKDNIGLTIEDWRAMKRKYKNTSFIIISQGTKDGGFRGTNEWPHEVDCHISSKDGIISTVGNKNRFGQQGTYNVFTDEIIN